MFEGGRGEKSGRDIRQSWSKASKNKGESTTPRGPREAVT